MLMCKLKLLYTNINVASFTIKVYTQECVLRMQLLCCNNYVGKRTWKSILPANVWYINYIFVRDIFADLSVHWYLHARLEIRHVHVVFLFCFLNFYLITHKFIFVMMIINIFTLTYIYYVKNNISDEYSH